MRIALNGFGRIGKNFLRVLLHQQVLYDLVAINIGPADPEAIAYAIRYDSILGRYEEACTYENGVLRIGRYTIEIYAEKDARTLPWKKLGIDWVIDATGRYTHREKAEEHLHAGARAVLISAPAHGDDISVIMGVNEHAYDAKKHTIVSLGSCTTNAVIPLLSVLRTADTLHMVSLTTTHAYTNSQALVDRMGGGRDLREDRAAALNIIPAHTGALDMAVRIMPELAGKVIGCALRVPVAVVSIIDLVVVMESPWSEQQVRELFIQASSKMSGILAVTDEPLVSSDFQGTTASVTVDLGITTACGNVVKVMGWYDNEYAYSARLADFLTYVYQQKRA